MSQITSQFKIQPKNSGWQPRPHNWLNYWNGTLKETEARFPADSFEKLYSKNSFLDAGSCFSSQHDSQEGGYHMHWLLLELYWVTNFVNFIFNKLEIYIMLSISPHKSLFINIYINSLPSDIGTSYLYLLKICWFGSLPTHDSKLAEMFISEFLKTTFICNCL